MDPFGFRRSWMLALVRNSSHFQSLQSLLTTISHRIEEKNLPALTIGRKGQVGCSGALQGGLAFARRARFSAPALKHGGEIAMKRIQASILCGNSPSRRRAPEVSRRPFSGPARSGESPRSAPQELPQPRAALGATSQCRRVFKTVSAESHRAARAGISTARVPRPSRPAGEVGGRLSSAGC